MYAVSTLQKVSKLDASKMASACLILVVCEIKEIQRISELYTKLAKYIPYAWVVTCSGGTSISLNREELMIKPNIVIGNSGRIGAFARDVSIDVPNALSIVIAQADLTLGPIGVFCS